MKNKYPDSLTIQQYLEGNLDPEIMYELEKQALEDPFLSDALDGYTAHTGSAEGLSILQRQLHERIVHLQENKKVFDLTWQRLSVAAAAAVLFVLAGILFWMNGHRPSEQMASADRQVEVQTIHPDSVQAVLRSADAASPLDDSQLSNRQTTVSAFEPGTGKEETLSAASAVSDAEETGSEAQELLAGRAKGPAAARSVAASATIQNESAPRPEIGWKLYREYLDKSISKFKTGTSKAETVLLSVLVNKEGKLIDIKTIRGFSPALDKEAIRMVKEGPGWKGDTDNTASEVLVEVIFKP